MTTHKATDSLHFSAKMTKAGTFVVVVASRVINVVAFKYKRKRDVRPEMGAIMVLESMDLLKAIRNHGRQSDQSS